MKAALMCLACACGVVAVVVALPASVPLLVAAVALLCLALSGSDRHA